MVNEFHKRLQDLALGKNKFQSDLVTDLKKNSSTISKWWNGDIVPGPKNMRMIAGYFGCDIAWLATGQGKPYPEKTESKSISATGGSTIVSGGRDAINISDGGEPFQITQLERKALEINRAYGSDEKLKEFIKNVMDL